jgi:uncharacterized protein YkwD
MLTLLAVALLCSSLTLQARSGSNPAADDKDKKEPPKLEMTEDEKTILDLTNKERAKKDLPLLKPNPILCKVARAHSANMAKQDKVEHVLDGKTWGDRAKEGGYKFEVCGENVGWGEWTGKKKWSAADMMKWWMESQAHRENIVHKEFIEIGVGIVEKDGKRYFTQLFAAPFVD